MCRFGALHAAYIQLATAVQSAERTPNAIGVQNAERAQTFLILSASRVECLRGRVPQALKSVREPSRVIACATILNAAPATGDNCVKPLRKDEAQ